MILASNQHRPFGSSGLRVPPIVFDASPLANRRRVITDQAKLELCGEWFRHVEAPVFIAVSAGDGDGLALDQLGRAFKRFEIRPPEALLALTLNLGQLRNGPETATAAWEDACRRIGGKHAPRLVAIEIIGDFPELPSSPAERDYQLRSVVEACQLLDRLRTTGQVAGLGIAAADWRIVRHLDPVLHLDWVMFRGGFTIMRHSPEILQYMLELRLRQIPIVCSGVFEGEFLVGGNRFGCPPANQETAGDANYLAWRKAFTALCHGHGVAPAHACIQFALAGPGVAAVKIETTHADRVAENAASCAARVPDSFWAAMQEEGLLNEDYLHLP